MKLKRIGTLLFLIILLIVVYAIKKCDQCPPFPKECAFCDKNIIMTQNFYQDDLVTALLSYRPITPGHTLIIPNRHVERFEELTTDEIGRIMHVIKIIHGAVSSLYQTSSYLLLQKNGREAFQTVPHVHFHYISKAPGDYSQINFLLKMIAADIKNSLRPDILKKETDQLKHVMQEYQSV